MVISWGKLFAVTLLGMGCALTSVHAAGLPLGVIGKDGWLFYRFDYSDEADIQTTDTTLDLIKRFNKVISANGTILLLVLPPLKMKVYSGFLPPSVKINPTMMGQADRSIKILRTSQVNVVDLNSPFLDSKNQSGPFPLFYKLDSHWSPSGVLLASETIKSYIEATPILKKTLDLTPIASYRMEISKAKKTNNSHDLTMEVPLSPQAQKSFPPEDALLFNVSRVRPQGADDHGSSISLIGTSNSKPWTGFTDALRYALQRDITASTTLGDRGSWVGMESFLRDDNFQVQRPKLLIWEMPERDLRASPNYRFRTAPYLQDNTEWLLKASALVQTTCKPSSVSGKLGLSGLAANSSNQKTGGIVTGSTLDTDFIEINFNDPIGKLDYIAARISTLNSRYITLEASGSDVTTRQFKVDVAGDSAEHVFRFPLPSNGKGYTKVRIFPGKTSGFSFQGLQVCRQPEDLLK